jgi:chemotaxis protein MotB
MGGLICRMGAVVLACALATAPGCVSKAKHEKATAALGTCEQERAALETEKSRLERELAEKLSATEGELAELRRQREAQLAQLETFRKFTEKLKAMIDVGDIDVSIRRGRLVVGMPSQVLFPSGKHELSPKGQATLAKVAAALKELADRRFIVAGHTDDKPIGEKLKELYFDNWDLSTERALAVTRYLIEQGVAPGSLAAAGYGEHDPSTTNKSAGGRRKNRRIELIVEPLLAELPELSEIPSAPPADAPPAGEP